MIMVTQTDLDRSISFDEYFDLVKNLAETGRTTGDDQSKNMIDYTKLNFSRMKRVLKTTQASTLLKETINCLNDQLTWLVLAESWCGDAAQNIPIFAKMSEFNPNINLRIILRDENPELMDRYLTNGGKSIPKLICLDKELNEIGTWGPRPQFLQNWLYQEKETPTMEMSKLKEQFQVWYTKDKGETLQTEMIHLMKRWLNKECMSL
ncbi:MAG: thioredoxin family protein [Flavobacteriales bacterium]|nr:thioredoxin family protein [Flavobacteriales bacterium]MCB9334772.1 thioredoxin family protein [Flavobacteriales bacterium]